MRKEDEKLIRKKQMAEHMLNSIDAKYIKQAADYRPKIIGTLKVLER